MNKVKAAAAMGAITAFAFGAYLVAAPEATGFDHCRTAAIAGGAGDIGGPFTLVDHTGETVTEAEVLDRPALVYFGYTFCPDVCPLDTVRNADAVDLLAEMGHSVRPVMITVDPARDTPEAMADFAENLHPDMVGLTGTPDQVSAAAAAYRVYYNAHASGDEFYLVDHSTFTYLMLPGHGFVEFFRRDIPAGDLARRAACFIEAG